MCPFSMAGAPQNGCDKSKIAEELQASTQARTGVQCDLLVFLQLYSPPHLQHVNFSYVFDAATKSNHFQ